GLEGAGVQAQGEGFGQVQAHPTVGRTQPAVPGPDHLTGGHRRIEQGLGVVGKASRQHLRFPGRQRQGHAGQLGTADGWVRLHLAEALPLGLDAGALEASATALVEDSLPARLLTLLRETAGALRTGEILTALADREQAEPPPKVHDALWELAFAGLITNDSFAALRSYVRGPSPAHGSRASRRSRPVGRRGAARLSAAMMRQGASSPSELVVGPTGSGRWSALRV